METIKNTNNFIPVYTFKLKCPICNSKDCTSVHERIIEICTDTDKNGWLKKRSYTVDQGQSNADYIKCNQCGYFSPSSEFIVDEKEIL